MGGHFFLVLSHRNPNPCHPKKYAHAHTHSYGLSYNLPPENTNISKAQLRPEVTLAQVFVSANRSFVYLTRETQVRFD